MAGVALISFNGSRMELNPVGDVLAVLAAFVWRRTFFYGILFMDVSYRRKLPLSYIQWKAAAKIQTAVIKRDMAIRDMEK